MEDEHPVRPLLTIRHLISESLQREKDEEEEEYCSKSTSSASSLRWHRRLSCRLRHRSAAKQHQTPMAFTAPEICITGSVTEPKDNNKDEEEVVEVDFEEELCCSAGMVSDDEAEVEAAAAAAAASSFIMNRFLPAAKELASVRCAAVTRSRKTQAVEQVPRGQLPRQSRPIPMALGRHEEEMQEPKSACAGLLSQRLKQLLLLRADGRCFWPLRLLRKKPWPSPSFGVFSDDDDDDSSSCCTEDEKAIIAEARKKAWKMGIRSGYNLNLQAMFSTLPPKTGITTDVLANKEEEEEEEEQWYSGKSSPLEVEEQEEEEEEEEKDKDTGVIVAPATVTVAGVAAPPLPKSPTESWLCGAALSFTSMPKPARNLLVRTACHAP